MVCQEYGKSQPLIGTTQELPPFPWHTLSTDLFYWNRMEFLMVADVFSKYILGPVWVQHGQNAQWEPAVVINKTDAPNSYWIMYENDAQQPRVYRCTRTFLKIRSTPTDGEQKAQMKE